jgi:tetratricopeptide (TPR) repeat protein
MTISTSEIPLHLRIAEQGKVHTLEKDYVRALGCYRLAMRLTAERGDREAFFRHYLESLVEALELDGSYDAVLEYCDRMDDMFDQADGDADLRCYDRASLRQRRGIALLKMDRLGEAEQALADACSMAGSAGSTLPLAETLLRWLRSHLRIDPRRLFEEQQRHRYFSIRPDTVRADIATRLTDAEIFGAMAAGTHSNA